MLNISSNILRKVDATYVVELVMFTLLLEPCSTILNNIYDVSNSNMCSLICKILIIYIYVYVYVYVYSIFNNFASYFQASMLWRKRVTAIASQYPDVELSHMYVDNAAMQLVRNPKQVIILLNSKAEFYILLYYRVIPS